MTKAKTLSLFSLQTRQGQELRNAIIPLAHRLGFEVKPELSQPTIANVSQAVFSDDAVIFDGSMEEGKHNYDIAFENLKRVDHALLVSRTPLPLNFYGTRASDNPACANAPRYPNTLSNESILCWLEQTLPTLPQRPLLQKNLLAHVFVVGHSTNAAAKRLEKQSQIFISYRSRLSKQVAELRAALRRGDFHNGVGRSVYFFEPATLAYDDEALAALRRWMVLSIISDVILACEEFWIYHSDDYLDSWWTRGELAILTYFKGNPKKIVLYNSTTGERRTLSYDDIPSLSNEHKNRMARWFSNSHPMMMGVESAVQLQRIATVPGLEKAPYIDDLVWKDAFWHDPVVECKSAKCTERLRKTWQPGSLLFDMEAFLFSRDPNLFMQTEDELAHAVGHRGVSCQQCGTSLTVARESPDRFLNLALPVAEGRDGPMLLRFPVYRIFTQASFWQRVTHRIH
ncbi:MAG: hypothetical protein ACXVDA_03385 [Ktedonobacterales bacterium]